jgi:hypothetical protein
MYIDTKTTEPCPTSWPVLCTIVDPFHHHNWVGDNKPVLL